MSKKVRGDAKLKTLPKAQQEKIIAWLDAETQSKVIDKIEHNYGVLTSASSLTEFYQWWHLSRRLEEATSFADQLKEDLKELPGLNLSDEQVSLAAQRIFELKALKEDNGELFYLLRQNSLGDEKLKLEKEKTKLARDRFEFSAAKAALKHAAQLKLIATDKGLSEQDKINAARKRLFGQVPE